MYCNTNTALLPASDTEPCPFPTSCTRLATWACGSPSMTGPFECECRRSIVCTRCFARSCTPFARECTVCAHASFVALSPCVPKPTAVCPAARKSALWWGGCTLSCRNLRPAHRTDAVLTRQHLPLDEGRRQSCRRPRAPGSGRCRPR